MLAGWLGHTGAGAGTHTRAPTGVGLELRAGQPADGNRAPSPTIIAPPLPGIRRPDSGQPVHLARQAESAGRAADSASQQAGQWI